MPSLSTYCLTGVSLTLDVGYLLMAAAPDLERGVSPLGHLPRNITSQLMNLYISKGTVVSQLPVVMYGREN